MTDDTNYQIPGHNQVSLTDELANEIRERFARDRDNRFRLFLIAAGLRNRYLDKKTKSYVKEFDTWYKREKFQDYFGTLANFTKYASAGDVVAYISETYGDETPKFLKQIPTSVGAMYEASQILTYDNDLMNLCLRFTVKRTSVDQPKDQWVSKKPALLNPHATEAQIRTWRRNWLNPPPPRQKRTDKRTLLLATVTVSGELFDFNRKTGDKIGCVDLPEVEELLNRLRTLFPNPDDPRFKITDNIDVLTTGYYKRKDYYDPANAILNKERRQEKRSAPSGAKKR
jgi:hypothetical protein